MPNRNSYRRNSGICSNCGHSNRPDARLCVECYTSLRSTETERLSRDPLNHFRSRRGSRSSGASRADAIRAQVQGTDRPTTSSRDESQPWWQDWKTGAMVAGFLGMLGLRKTELGKDLRNLDGEDILDKLL